MKTPYPMRSMTRRTARTMTLSSRRARCEAQRLAAAGSAQLVIAVGVGYGVEGEKEATDETLSGARFAVASYRDAGPDFAEAAVEGLRDIVKALEEERLEGDG